MKFTIDKSCLESYSLKKHVEISDIFSVSDINDINHEIDRILELRGMTNLSTMDEIMQMGRDLFRESDRLNKSLKLKTLASITHDLTWQRPLRLGFEQLLQGGKSTLDLKSTSSFLLPSYSLAHNCGLNEMVVGIIIGLNVKSEKTSFLPTQTGHAVFFSPELELDLQPCGLGERYLMIGIAGSYSQYLYEENDPQNHYLKKIGYVYGDKLKDNLHPILFR